MSLVRVSLDPRPGFVVKSTSVQSTTYKPSDDSGTGGISVLEVSPKTVAVPKGLKVFVNVAWDDNVPPPPSASEDVIQKAMTGEDEDLNQDTWYIPMIVSDGRKTTDKAGKPALVFDCVANVSLKPRTSKDHGFKAFIAELALQRVEAHSSIVFARPWAMPNIAAKGPLEPRAAAIPAHFYPPDHPNRRLVAPEANRKLVQEVDAAGQERSPQAQQPSWTWSEDGDALRITIQLPHLTRALAARAALDLEPRRLILHAPPLYALDVDLSASDAELHARGAGTGAESALTLKRMRDFDVDRARAEWRVGEDALHVMA